VPGFLILTPTQPMLYFGEHPFQMGILLLMSAASSIIVWSYDIIVCYYTVRNFNLQQKELCSASQYPSRTGCPCFISF